MDISFYQICFSNDNGWHAFNYSKNTPSDAIKAFESIQNRYIGVGDAFTRESVINYFVDSGYVFIAKMIYGYSDRFGRSCHFAQAFCFPQSEIMDDPDYLTGVSDSNFTIQPTQNMVESLVATNTPPEKLILCEPSALRLSVDMQKFFSYSVLNTLTSIRKLSIIYDGQSSSAKGIFSFILKTLPQTLCKQISLTTFKKPISEKIVLCTSENAFPKNLDLVSGTCSFLDQKDLDETSKYRFANCYNCTESDATYLKELDSCLQQLEFSESLKINHLRIADFFLSVESDSTEGIPSLQQKSFDELYATLNLILTFDFNRTYYSDLKTAQFISYLLKHHANELNGSMYEKIVAFAADSNAEPLNAIAISCIIRIITSRFNIMTAAQQKEYLYSLMLSPAAFALIQKELQMTAEGRDIIDLYYLDELKAVWNVNKTENIITFLQKISNTDLYPKTVCYFEQAVTSSCAQLFSVYDDEANLVLKKGLEELCKPLSDGNIADRCFSSIKTNFWTSFNPAQFDWDNPKVATSAISSNSVCVSLLHIIDVVKSVQTYSGEDDRTSLFSFLNDLSDPSKNDQLLSVFGKSGLDFIIISVICKECARSENFKTNATLLEAKSVAFLNKDKNKIAEYMATVGFQCILDIQYEKDPIFKPEYKMDLHALMDVLDQYDGVEKKAVNALKSDLKSACKAMRKDEIKKEKISDHSPEENDNAKGKIKREVSQLLSFFKRK